MDHLDNNGWVAIHHAALRNYAKSVEQFLENSGMEELEIETKDGLRNTPLLLAVLSASQQTVELLVNLGANITVINARNLGVVEICALHGYVELLEYFISLNNPKLNVYQRLVKFVNSDSEEETLSANKVIAMMTDRKLARAKLHVLAFIDQGLVPSLLDVLNKTCAEIVKEHTLKTLNNILQEAKAKEQLFKNNGFSVLTSLISKRPGQLLVGTVNAIHEIASEKDYAEALFLANAVPVLTEVLNIITKCSNSVTSQSGVLIYVLNSLGLMAQACTNCKEAIGKEHGLLSIMAEMFEECNSKSVLIALSEAIATIVEYHSFNQDAFIDKNVAAYLIQLAKAKSKDLQLSAIKTLHRLVEGNSYAQKNILDYGGAIPLMQLLKKRQTQNIQEVVVQTLWALSGKDTEKRRTMATKIGVNTLVEFLGSLSEELQHIGIEGLSSLVRGPFDVRNVIASANGMQHLVRLLRSPKEDIVLQTTQALRHMCLSVGYVPHHQNQRVIADSKGLQFLIALMTYSQSEVIQVEAAWAVAAAVLGNRENMELLYENSVFNYMHILQLLYSSKEGVCLLASGALATFAFNNLRQQEEIVQSGGIRWHNLQPFLGSKNEIYRVNAAFQCIVLCRTIPDNEPANTTATGIKTIVDVLEQSHSKDALALAADCLARLAHTRAGIPAAIASLNAIGRLCNLLSCPAEQVRGCAAIALGYLSFNHQAERQLLKRCRKEHHLVKILLYYTRTYKLSPTFLERWKHLKELSLPPI
uniref:Uncharacterized protein n=1 Tax=Latimeria chalumnae TaxID=7897 RepID=H3AXI9_LATCH